MLNGRVETDDYYFFQGTSMASPHVAGVAALVIGRGVKDPKKVRHLLEETAVDKGDRLRYGAGIVNAAEAVSRAGEPEGERAGSWLDLSLIPYPALQSFIPHPVRHSWGPALMAGALLGALAWWWRRRGVEWSGVTARSLAGLMLGAWGLNWLPAWIGGNVLLHSAWVAVGVGVLLWGVVRWRPVWGGLCVGVGAHLLWDGVSGAGGLVGLPWWLAGLWLIVNGGLAVVVGSVMWRSSSR
jgi:serine protease